MKIYWNSPTFGWGKACEYQINVNTESVAVDDAFLLRQFAPGQAAPIAKETGPSIEAMQVVAQQWEG